MRRKEAIKGRNERKIDKKRERGRKLCTRFILCTSDVFVLCIEVIWREKICCKCTLDSRSSHEDNYCVLRSLMLPE